MRGRKRLYLLLATILLAPALILDSSEQVDENLVLWVEVSDFIGSGTVDHVRLAIDQTSDRRYVAVVLAIDTFGGLVDSMFSIVEAIESSPVPVIGFVYPQGRQSLSAGTFILMATDLAAMAPFTKIGSAQPVLGGVPINDTKTINALVKEMEGLAEIHMRNKTQLTRFITHNDNLLPDEAIRFGAVEILASSREDLLEKADGRIVHTINGEKTLNLEGSRFVDFQEVPRVALVRILSDPVLSSLLVSLGILILILGLTSPGYGAEVVGAVLLLLGLVGQGFNVNYAAMAIIGLGAALLIFELYTPSFGLAGIGGIVLLAGGMIFFVTRPPGPLLITPDYFNTFTQTILGAMAVAGVVFGILIYKFAQVRRMKTPLQKYPTGEGRAVDDIAPDGEGYVVVQGEYWKARSRERIQKGDKITVTGAGDGVLLVEAWKEREDSAK